MITLHHNHGHATAAIAAIMALVTHLANFNEVLQAVASVVAITAGIVSIAYHIRGLRKNKQQP